MEREGAKCYSFGDYIGAKYCGRFEHLINFEEFETRLSDIFKNKMNVFACLHAIVLTKIF